jgi:glutamate carboxypeptidase
MTVLTNSLLPSPKVSLYKFMRNHFRMRPSKRARRYCSSFETERIEMNPANLPFDSEVMLQGLRGWVECESPTWDASAVNRMLDIAARDMAIMGASIERIAGRQGFGGCVRARFPHPKQGEPGILIAGHLDTVHPVGTLEKLKWRREGNKCFGPGIFDMKGGNYLTLDSLAERGRLMAGLLATLE